ncbi:MAG: ABC transporter ATP-binding protein [Leadbetterella sp.]
MLITKGITYSYSSENAFSFPDLDIKENDIALIHGKSGVGKSTLLQLLGLFLEPTSGSISFQGKYVQKLSQADKNRFRAQNFGYVFQNHYFVKSLTVFDNLKMVFFLLNKKPNYQRIRTVLESLGILHLQNKYTHEISGGEQQRVSIARALIHAPKLVLADEPTSALDDLNTQSVFNLLRKYCKDQNTSLVIVSHDARLQSQISHQYLLQ